MNNNKKIKVVFTFVEAGYGHIMPMTGLCDAFEKKYGDKCEVVRSYIFSEDNNEKLNKYKNELISYAVNDSNNYLKSSMDDRLTRIIGSKLTLKILDLHFRNIQNEVFKKIDDLNPDMLVASYYSPSHFVVNYNKKFNKNILTATYTPDPTVYSAWDRNTDIFLVNNDRANRIAKKQFKHEVYQIPFILRKEIIECDNISQQDIRKKLSLPQNNFTCLLCDGAYGMKKIKEFTEILINLDKEITVVSICGKNEKLLEYFKTLTPNPKVTFVPLGFVKNILEYDKASNLFIGKSGASNLVEGFYNNVPAIVSSYANRLEKYIADYYINEKHCGEIIFSKKKFKKRILEILDNPQLLDEYKQNCKEFNNSSGADKGADIIFERLCKQFPILKKSD